MNRIARYQLRDRLTAVVLVAVVLALLLPAVTPIVSDIPRHPPDAHSSLPHFASSTVLSSDRAAAPDGSIIAPSSEPRLRGYVEARRMPGSVDAAPPDQPPR